MHQDVHQDISPALATWGPGIAYSRLMRFSSGPEVELPSLAVECELCLDWKLLDETTFEFKLRKDVLWQDIGPVNGRELDAEDIVFSYNRQRTEGFANAPLLHVMESAEAVSPDILRISLLAPDSDFFVSLADGHSKIVASEAVAVRGDLKDGPTIGTSPWIFTGTQSGVAHNFERNPDYFEKGLPFAEKLNIHIITDETTRGAAFRVRTTDVQQMEPREWEEFRRRQPDMPFLLAREAGVGLEVAFKTTAQPFDDLRTRKAALLAMDPWKAIEDVWLGAAYLSQGVQPIRADWLLTEPELGEFFDDPQKARDLLQSVGSKVPVTIKVGEFSGYFTDHAMRIADEMREVGFEPEVEVVNRRRFGEEVWLGGNYQMFVGPVAPTTSPNGYLFPVLHGHGQWNTTEHQDDTLDALIERQAQEFDPIERRELLIEIQRRAFDNAYRFMPATRVSIWTWWPRVQGFHPNFAGFEYSHWSRVWLR